MRRAGNGWQCVCDGSLPAEKPKVGNSTGWRRIKQQTGRKEGREGRKEKEGRERKRRERWVKATASRAAEI